MIMVLPMLSLAASYGLSELKGAGVRRFFTACVVTSSLSVALFAYLPFMQKFSATNLRDAGAFLDTLPQRCVKVFTLIPREPVVGPEVSIPILDLFTHKKIVYDGGDALSAKEREEIERSSLRFTVEYKNPSFYVGAPCSNEDSVAAVISETADEPMPPAVQTFIAGFGRTGVFDKYEGIFRYRTSVSIYQRIPEER